MTKRFQATKRNQCFQKIYVLARPWTWQSDERKSVFSESEANVERYLEGELLARRSENFKRESHSVSWETDQSKALCIKQGFTC